MNLIYCFDTVIICYLIYPPPFIICGIVHWSNIAFFYQRGSKSSVLWVSAWLARPPCISILVVAQQQSSMEGSSCFGLSPLYVFQPQALPPASCTSLRGLFASDIFLKIHQHNVMLLLLLRKINDQAYVQEGLLMSLIFLVYLVA